jgi:hypothetical protein
VPFLVEDDEQALAGGELLDLGPAGFGAGHRLVELLVGERGDDVAHRGLSRAAYGEDIVQRRPGVAVPRDPTIRPTQAALANPRWRNVSMKDHSSPTRSTVVGRIFARSGIRRPSSASKRGPMSTPLIVTFSISPVISTSTT